MWVSARKGAGVWFPGCRRVKPLRHPEGTQEMTTESGAPGTPFLAWRPRPQGTRSGHRQWHLSFMGHVDWVGCGALRREPLRYLRGSRDSRTFPSPRLPWSRRGRSGACGVAEPRGLVNRGRWGPTRGRPGKWHRWCQLHRISGGRGGCEGSDRSGAVQEQSRGKGTCGDAPWGSGSHETRRVIKARAGCTEWKQNREGTEWGGKTDKRGAGRGALAVLLSRVLPVAGLSPVPALVLTACPLSVAVLLALRSHDLWSWCSHSAGLGARRRPSSQP